MVIFYYIDQSFKYDGLALFIDYPFAQTTTKYKFDIVIINGQIIDGSVKWVKNKVK